MKNLAASIDPSFPPQCAGSTCLAPLHTPHSSIVSFSFGLSAGVDLSGAFARRGRIVCSRRPAILAWGRSPEKTSGPRPWILATQPTFYLFLACSRKRHAR